MAVVPSKKKTFDELYEDIEKIGDGGMAEARLIRLKGKQEN